VSRRDICSDKTKLVHGVVGAYMYNKAVYSIYGAWDWWLSQCILFLTTVNREIDEISDHTGL